MTKRLVAIVMMLSASVWAQRGGGYGRGGPTTPGNSAPPPRMQPPATPPSSVLRSGSTIGLGFGNVVFPGTGNPGSPTYSPYGVPFPTALGATLSGGPIPGYNNGLRSRQTVIPVAVPVYVGGYGYDYAPAPQTIVYQQPQQPAPSVIINQNFTPETARPVTQMMPDTSLQSYQAPVPSYPDPGQRTTGLAFDEKPTIYLIAFKDGVVYQALSYWVESGSLHYVTTKHDMNQASLELIDTTISEQLNQERGVEFKLRK